MKIRTLICLIIINIVLCFNAYSFHYPVAKATLKVVDDEGKPVEGAYVGIGFMQFWNSDWGISINGYTDKNGLFTAKGETHGTINYGAEKEGYYNTDGEYKKFELNKDKTKWYPWNPIIKVVLKRKKNPIPMYEKGVETRIPIDNKSVGYDLLKGDWVKPYGKGEVSDFIFKVERKIKDEDNYEVKIILTFSNEKDGIQIYYYPYRSGSEFKFPYEAPLEGYKNKLVRIIGCNKNVGEYDNIENNDKVNYIFRVRTRTDENGKIINAMYGCIYENFGYGGWMKKTIYMRFYYILNPTGTRNLEYNPDKNLFDLEKSDDKL